MEYVEGGTLAQNMLDARNKPLSIEEIVRIFHELLKAVDHMHFKNMMHRDLKP
jgi:serine/threonine protein kinase